MAAKWHVISSAASTALATSTACEGPRVTIASQLAPDHWRQVKTILEKLGAVYVERASAFEFEPDRDARTLLGEALGAGRVMHDANRFGYVPTPAELAEDLVKAYAECPPKSNGRVRVLEPSAGTGRFVTAAAEWIGREWLHVTAVEPDARRVRQIERGEHVTVIEETFEAFAARARAAGERFDLILMNPPFSVPGEATIWVTHLRAAWQLLAPGGRLVAIVPARVLRKGSRGPVGAAQELVAFNGHGCELERDAFAESGIVYDTAVVWLDRPLIEAFAAPLAPSGHPAHFRPYTGAEVPVLVQRAQLTRAAARSMPVQAWRDGWRGGRVRILRYCAECIACELPVWGFDDGENDPRGVLGEHSAGWSIDPDEVEDVGPTPIGVCATCANDGASSKRAHDLARALARRPAGASASSSHTLPQPPARTPRTRRQPTDNTEGQLMLAI